MVEPTVTEDTVPGVYPRAFVISDDVNETAPVRELNDKTPVFVTVTLPVALTFVLKPVFDVKEITPVFVITTVPEVVIGSGVLLTSIPVPPDDTVIEVTVPVFDVYPAGLLELYGVYPSAVVT